MNAISAIILHPGDLIFDRRACAAYRVTAKHGPNGAMTAGRSADAYCVRTGQKRTFSLDELTAPRYERYSKVWPDCGTPESRELCRQGQERVIDWALAGDVGK